MAREKQKMITLDYVKKVAQEDSRIMAKEFFGYRESLFDGHIEVVEDIPRYNDEVPHLLRGANNAKLTLSVSGASVWEDQLQTPDGVDPVSLYVRCGIALLELANVVSYSQSCNGTESIPRLRNVEKAFRTDKSANTIAEIIELHTGINMPQIVKSLDNDDYTTISKLRYSIGVALKSLGFTLEEVEEFGSANTERASNCIKNYNRSVKRVLNDKLFTEELALDAADTSSEEVTQNVILIDFPFVQVAASLPMNVTYLLNRV